MKILVTGTAGFIGSALALKLAQRGDEVIGIDSINNYYDIRVKYGRLHRDGIISDIEHGDDIEYGKAIISTKYPNLKFIKLNLEDREGLFNIFREEKFDAVCKSGCTSWS